MPRYQIVIEYDAPHVTDHGFSPVIAEMLVRKALGNYLNELHGYRLNTIEKLYNIETIKSTQVGYG